MVKKMFLNLFFFFQTTNFANPMYARLYTTDSTQILLPKESDGDDMLDKNGDLNFLIVFCFCFFQFWPFCLYITIYIFIYIL